MRYRRRALEVDAARVPDGDPDAWRVFGEWLGIDAVPFVGIDDGITIHRTSSDDDLRAEIGDWVVRDGWGMSVCPGDRFDDLYEEL
jgi:hypothetical protein